MTRVKHARPRWTSVALTFGPLALLTVAGCGGAVATLHQVAWDEFSLMGPSPETPPPRIDVPAGASNDQKFAALTAFLRKKMHEAHLPGLAVAVILDGKLAYSMGLGKKRAPSGEPVTAHTLFRAASTSKLVTAVGLMTLVERGQVDLDRPVTELAPWFTRRAGDDPRRVTLRQALAQTAALPDDGQMRCATPPGWRLRDYFTAHARDPLWAEPGSFYNYSNTNYALIGGVIEERSGRGFDDFLREAVFVPAGMTSATLDPATARAGDFADGHNAKGAPLAGSRDYDCGFLHAPGGVIASVEDYAHLLETLLAGGGTMLTPASVATLETDRIATHERPDRNYASGLFTFPYHGVRVLAHPGGMPGYSTLFAMVPERGFGVALFTNGEGGTPATWLAAIDLFLDLPPVSPPARHTPPSSWRDYEGTYRDPAGKLGRFAVELHGNRLVMKLLGGQPAPISTLLAGVFWRDASGRVTHFVTRQGVAQRE